MKIPIHGLGGNLFVEIDDVDEHLVAPYKWQAMRKPPSKTIYCVSTIDGKFWSIHRWLLRPEPKQKIDHKDRDGLNNRRENLRPCTHSQNMANMGKPRNNTSGFKGVFFHKYANKWRAQIYFQNKQLSLGYHATKESAARQYDAKATELFGEFAWTNFPRQALINEGSPVT